MSTGNDIRSAFVDFFARHGHTPVASSPLVPRNDPTLMFVNSGMVQFKNVFTGLEQRDYSRAVTSQKCVRAGGKHNDLENVGYTARHHTFFEMLGNFSFGDYFKDVAIELAWNLITKEYGLPADRLLATVYADDDEAFDLWRKIAGLPESRVIRIGTSDNFWSMGDTGPCGPCSEIFYDHGDHIPGGPPGSPDEDGDRFIEVWNLVFMQFEQLEDGRREALPRPSIDTGIGLERVTAILQGHHDNYDTDLIRPIMDAAAGATDGDPDGGQRASYKAIADHLRASAFLIADGVLPSNEGRGYVLRRIMRRAMRHARMVGARDPLMHRLVKVLNDIMGHAFPELLRAEALIAETLKLEETRFRQTLDRGLRLLAEETGRLADGETLAGDVAFRLYDTYGFPLDLTQDVLRGQGRAVDLDGFNAAMDRQRAEARKAWAGSGDKAEDTIWFSLRDRHGATEFLGYETETAEGQVLALVRDGATVERAEAGDAVSVIANQTPFYAESGGQIGDTGTLEADDGRIAISDTVNRADGLHVHIGKVAEGAVSAGEAVRLIVDGERRTRVRANHSVTHLAHEALRRVLGDHVTQKGSLVGPDRMRFDFSHPKALTPEETAAVEDDVNRRIRANGAVLTRLMTPEAAVEAGALALFGEKYGDEVRVVSMGPPATGEAGDYYSTELCGGTHVRRTGDIGLFRIVSESAVAAGVRRIEVVTGAAAERIARSEAQSLAAAAAVLKTGPADSARAPRCVARRTQETRTGTGRGPARAGHCGGGGRRQRGGRTGDAPGQRHRLRPPRPRRCIPERPQADGRRSESADRLRRRGPGHRQRRQGLPRRRRYRRSDRPDQCGRSGAHRLGGAGRQGRRRAARHGPGRRPEPGRGRGGAGGDRKRAERRGGARGLSRTACAPAALELYDDATGLDPPGLDTTDRRPAGRQRPVPARRLPSVAGRPGAGAGRRPAGRNRRTDRQCRQRDVARVSGQRPGHGRPPSAGQLGRRLPAGGGRCAERRTGRSDDTAPPADPAMGAARRRRPPRADQSGDSSGLRPLAHLPRRPADGGSAAAARSAGAGQSVRIVRRQAVPDDLSGGSLLAAGGTRVCRLRPAGLRRPCREPGGPRLPDRRLPCPPRLPGRTALGLRARTGGLPYERGGQDGPPLAGEAGRLDRRHLRPLPDISPLRPG